jgi:hypothetical protein
MKLHIEIDMDGAAFDDPLQVGEILDAVSRDMESFVPGKKYSRGLGDINGNPCGRAWTTED